MRIVRDQRAVDNIEIGLELLRAGIGGRFSNRRPCGFHIQPDGGRGESGVDTGHRQALIGRAPGERAQILRDIGEVCREREFGAQRVQFFKVESQHAARLHAQRAAHDVCRDERVAVAVAADPASHPQEGRQLRSGGRFTLVQSIFQRAMQPWHLVQEGVVVKRKTVGDLVEYGQLGTAQQIGLPQRQHRAAQLLVAGLDLFRRKLDAFATVQQRGDFHFAVHGALAANLGRVRSQNWADQGALEKATQAGRAEAGRARMRQGRGQRPRARQSAGGRARPHLADIVLIFGDVGEMREITEGPHDANGFRDRHAVEDNLELAPRRPVVIPVEPDRSLPDALDQVEHVGTFLIAHGIAKDAPEQPDVRPQPGIFFKRLGFVGAIGLEVGVGRHDLGRHG